MTEHDVLGWLLVQVQSDTEGVAADLGHILTSIIKDQQGGGSKAAEGRRSRGGSRKPAGAAPAEEGERAADQPDGQPAGQQLGKTTPASRGVAKANKVIQALKDNGLLPPAKRCNGGELGSDWRNYAVPPDGHTCSCGGSCKGFREEYGYPGNLPVVDFARNDVYVPVRMADALLAWAKDDLKHEGAQAQLQRELAILDSKYKAEDAAHSARQQAKVCSSSTCNPSCSLSASTTGD